MCWDYSDCGVCGKRTYCIVVSDSPDARDCKSFDRCTRCYAADICEDCWYAGKEVCEECEVDK